MSDNKQTNKINSDSDSEYETPRTTRQRASRNNIRLANTDNQSPERISKNKKALATLREATKKSKVKPFADNLKLCLTRLDSLHPLPSTSRQVVFDSGSDLEINTRQIEPIDIATLSETERVLSNDNIDPEAEISDLDLSPNERRLVKKPIVQITLYLHQTHSTQLSTF